MSRDCVTSLLTWFLLTVVKCPSYIVNAQYFTGYLQESCRCSAITHFHCESFTLSPLGGAATSGFVLLSRDTQFAREFYCTYVIEAPRDMLIAARINHLQLPMLGTSCRASVLRLYDGNSTQRASRQLIGLCGSALPAQTTFVSTSNSLTVSYHHSVDVASQTKSFNITFTYFTVRHTGCLEAEFKCHSSSRCISASLVCDGVDNCADSSDESTHFDVCGKQLRTSNPFIGTTVGVAVCLLIVAFLMAIATGKAKRHRGRRDNTPTDECLHHHSSSAATGLPGPQVSNLSTVRQVDYSLSADQLTGATVSGGPALRHQVPAANHMTVAAVTHDVTRATPPPAYESLFPTQSNHLE